ncbi:MAG: hypothetical protein ACYC9S_12930 [Leptospirales bacterium]
MNSTPDQFELSGPARIRAMFHPRQRIGLIAAGKVIGLSYSRLFRRLKEGTITLKVRKDEFGQMFILIDDLCDYIFPPAEAASPSSTTPRKPGRPRLSTRKGGKDES